MMVILYIDLLNPLLTGRGQRSDAGKLARTVKEAR